MIKAIVFDVGGVLLRTEDSKSRRRLEEKYQLPQNSIDELVFNSEAAQASTIGQASREAVWEHVAKTLALDETELRNFIKAFWSGDLIDQSLVNFLEDCRPTFKTALLSNAWAGTRMILEEEYGIKEGKTVDYILISAECGVAKPDPQIYQILANTLKLPFHQMLFIDDFIKNIEAAQWLGIQTIHYQPGMDLINRVKSMLD